MISVECLVNDLEETEHKERNQLQRIVIMANLLLEQKTRVINLENELKAAKEAVGKTERNDLPQLMKEIGLKDFTLDDGSSVELYEEVQCGITEARRAEAHRWLTDNDFGGLIKTEIVVPFDRGAHEAAMELAEELLADGNECIMKESVHPQTLKSFVKEQLAAGNPIPLELFGVYPFELVKISLPKAKKTK